MSIELTPEHVRCRSLGHAWDVLFTKLRRDEYGTFYEATMTCLRCKSEKTDQCDPNGARFDRPRMHYANGYLLKGIDASRWEVAQEARLALYRSALKKGKP